MDKSHGHARGASRERSGNFGLVCSPVIVNDNLDRDQPGANGDQVDQDDFVRADMAESMRLPFNVRKKLNGQL